MNYKLFLKIILLKKIFYKLRKLYQLIRADEKSFL